jgi:uncharacterized protein (TIGR03437 family)
MKVLFSSASAVLLCGSLCIGQIRSPLFAGPSTIDISGDTYGKVTQASFVIVTASEPATRFKLDKIEANGVGTTGPTFLVITPSRGANIQQFSVGPNPEVIKTMLPGRYSLFLRFVTEDLTPPSTTGSFVHLTLSAPPEPKISRIVNSLSGTGPVTPGMVVSIQGTDLGPPVLSSTYDNLGVYPKEWGNTTVTFDGVAASLPYVSPERIDAFVPFAVGGNRTANVVVSRYDRSTPAFSVPVAESSPAVLTVSDAGTGQGFFEHYPGGSRNSSENPFSPGVNTAFTLFANGEGAWDVVKTNGGIEVAARNFRAKPISLTVGGVPATILYAGAAPYRPGQLQVNAQFRAGLPSSGQQPVVLKIGDSDNSLQGVTMAIR